MSRSGGGLGPRSRVDPAGRALRGIMPRTEVPIFRRTNFRHGTHMHVRRGRRGRRM
jgi:hypothetical protein